MMLRRVVAHMGPTNSGKTHAALQALKAAETGVYCGPLRLLAWEASHSCNSYSTGSIQSMHSHVLRRAPFYMCMVFNFPR